MKKFNLIAIIAPPSSLILVLYACASEPIQKDVSSAGSSGAPAAQAGAGQGGSAGADNAGASGVAGKGEGGKGEAGQDATGGKAGEAGSGGQDGNGCPAKDTPMVRLSTPSGIPYCIDTREVTQAQYAAFLDAKKGDMSGQDPSCTGSNITYEPEFALGGDNEPFTKCSPSQWDPKGKATWPVTCVGPCDARAYCKWVGKRLCGKVGGGTLMGDEEMLDPEKSQWYNACSQGGKTEYAYGSKQDPSKCKVSGPQEDSMGCHATDPPYNEILNLSGGLADMEDAKEVPGSFIQRGGRSNSESDYRCNRLSSINVTTATFRCCADL